VTKSDLIIFDCDGVLVDSEVLSCGRLSDALARHGIALAVPEAIDLFVGCCRSMASPPCWVACARRYAWRPPAISTGCRFRSA